MAKIVFSFRGKFGAADVASLQERVEAGVRALGLPEECEVFAKFHADGMGSVIVYDVPADLEEQVRISVSEELVRSHEAVVQED